MDKKQALYKQTIDLLKYAELVTDEKQFQTMRKLILDLANAILRIDDNG